MTEPMVQVPVSLIERIGDHVAREYEGDPVLDAMVLEVRALLSQPNPTAEPPRIEDLSRQIESFASSLRYETRMYPDLWARRLALVIDGQPDPGPMRTNESGTLVFVDTGEPVIDPSTIRDVVVPS